MQQLNITTPPPLFGIWLNISLVPVRGRPSSRRPLSATAKPAPAIYYRKKIRFYSSIIKFFYLTHGFCFIRFLVKRCAHVKEIRLNDFDFDVNHKQMP